MTRNPAGRFILILAVAVPWIALAILNACSPPTAPSPITINQVNTQTVGGGLTDPSAVAKQCLPSEEQPIRVDIVAPDAVTVGQSGTIDATPKSASGKRSDGCNVLQGIAWTRSPETTCHVKGPSDFNTAVICDARGTCGLTATVPGKGASGTSSTACQ